MSTKNLTGQALLLAMSFSSLSACNNGSSLARSQAAPMLNSTPARLSQQQGTTISELNQGDFQTGVFEGNDIIAYNLPQLAKHIVSLSVKNGLQIWQSDALPTTTAVSNSAELRKFLHEHQTELKSTPTPAGALVKPDNDQAIYYDQANQTLYWLAFNAQNTAEEWRFKLQTGSVPELMQQFNSELAVKDLQAIYFVEHGIDVLVDLSYLSRLTNSDGDTSDGLAHQLYPAYIKIPLQLRRPSLNSIAEPLSNYLQVSTTYVDSNQPSDQVTHYILANTNNQAVISEWSALADKQGNSWWQSYLPLTIASVLSVIGGVIAYKSFKQKYTSEILEQRNAYLLQSLEQANLKFEQTYPAGQNNCEYFAKKTQSQYPDVSITFELIRKMVFTDEEKKELQQLGFIIKEARTAKDSVYIIAQNTTNLYATQAKLIDKLQQIQSAAEYLVQKPTETEGDLVIKLRTIKYRKMDFNNLTELAAKLTTAQITNVSHLKSLTIYAVSARVKDVLYLHFEKLIRLKLLNLTFGKTDITTNTLDSITLSSYDLDSQKTDFLSSLNGDIAAIDHIANQDGWKIEYKKRQDITTFASAGTLSGTYLVTQAGIQKWWPLQPINCGDQVCDQVELKPNNTDNPDNKIILASGLVKTIKYTFNGKNYQLLVYQDFSQTCQQIATNLPTDHPKETGIYAELSGKDNKKYSLLISDRNGQLCNNNKPYSEFVNEVTPTNAGL